MVGTPVPDATVCVGKRRFLFTISTDKPWLVCMYQEFNGFEPRYAASLSARAITRLIKGLASAREALIDSWDEDDIEEWEAAGFNVGPAIKIVEAA